MEQDDSQLVNLESNEVVSQSDDLGTSEDRSRTLAGGSEERSSRSLVLGSDKNVTQSFGDEAESMAFSILYGSDEAFEISCDCCEDGLKRFADIYCVECSVNLCGGCRRTHALVRQFQKHVFKTARIKSPVENEINISDDQNDCCDYATVCNEEKRVNIVSKFKDTLARLKKRFKKDRNAKDADPHYQNLPATYSTSLIQRQKPKENPEPVTELFEIERLDDKQSIVVKTSKDTDCPGVTDLTVINDRYCIVSDSSNVSVKVIDTVYNNIISETILVNADYVYSITTVGDDTVAVFVKTIKNEGQIILLGVSEDGHLGEVSLVETLVECEEPLISLTYVNNIFYACTSKAVHKINKNGKIIETIEHIEFGELYGIAINANKNVFYITSISNDTVFCLTPEGIIQADYCYNDMKEPKGLTVDDEDFVYVCSMGTKCIHRLTKDLDKVQIIVQDVSVCRVVYLRNASELITAFGDELKLHKLEHLTQLHALDDSEQVLDRASNYEDFCMY